MTQHETLARFADQAERMADDLDQLWRTDTNISLGAREAIKTNCDTLASVACSLREIARRADAYAPNDTIRLWAARRTLPTPEARTGARVLYADYLDWCEANGHHAASLKVWGMTLVEMSWIKTRTGAGTVYLRRELVRESDA
jgi:hypothetical protein